MSYLTDDEHRILLAALRREKEFCSRQMTDSKRLVRIVQSLERKFYYDRFEQEIRNKVLDEFVKLEDYLMDKIKEDTADVNIDFEWRKVVCLDDIRTKLHEGLREIAEEMKEAVG